ncbi:MAG: transcription termination/antitermination protein NusA [Ruminococcaceae bacterium]|nr:transcription termination/antitermination protein NusA [Oscillospiraceae bacterium]
MNAEFIMALEAIAKEKNIDKDVLLEAVEAALVTAFKKDYGANQQVRAEINRETGAYHLLVSKEVVEDVISPQTEISLEEARKYSEKYEIGDIAEYDVTPSSYGRIAAQTAKQVVVQRIREAERDQVYSRFAHLEHELVSGVVRRTEKRNIIVEIDQFETVITPDEQVPGETYQPGERIKLYVAEVKKTTKGPRVVVSRSRAGLVKRLFEAEVPEVRDGIVEIKSISRDAGSRTKMAVWSSNESVDPIGACVGNHGARVQAVMDELRGEKIDIIKYSDDPVEYIKESLNPAKVFSVEVNEEEKSCHVVVPEFQLSLAIGKKGQNACLAAKLTGWKIDIQSQPDDEGTDAE